MSKLSPERINEASFFEAVARGWCSAKNGSKEMDVDLAAAIAVEVVKVWREYLTTEAAAKDATIARLTKPDTHTCLTCVHWGTSMSAYPCLECGQHYDRSDLWEGNEDNKPHLCVPTLDGNAHVIPTEVFDKIISGEMKITDMDDWEIITRTAFSEWLRGLETAAKTRVYKAAVDHIADTMAAGAWQDGPAPKDGSWILGLFYGLPYVVCYDSWEISEEGGPKETEEGWCLAGQDMHLMDQDEPEKWARIIHPNRHMPASWDGPGDQR